MRVIFEVGESSHVISSIRDEGLFHEAHKNSLNGEEGMVIAQISASGEVRAMFVEHEQAKVMCEIVKGDLFKMKESDLKKKIKQDFDKMGAWSYAPVQHGMGANGIPDRIACVPTVIKQEDVGKTLGLFVGAEAKMKGNKPTKLQKVQLDGIAAAGGKALVITGEKGKPYKVEEIKNG